MHRRVAEREAVRARVVGDVVQPQRPGVLDQHAEDAAAARQVADRGVLRLVDADAEESLQLGAALVEDAERGVLGAGQRARLVEHALQQRLQVQLGDDRAADVQDSSQASFVEHRGSRV